MTKYFLNLINIETTHPVLREKFPGFELEWKRLVNSLGVDFINQMRTHFRSELSLTREISEFQLTIVIDNNFIFGQIKSAVEKGTRICFPAAFGELGSFLIFLERSFATGIDTYE